MKRDNNLNALLIGLETGQGDEMSKLCLGLASAFFIVAISFSGCCAPVGGFIGPGCATQGCNDCNGGCSSPQYIANGPIDAIRNARRRLVCGSGCGEVYVGEWISTPPDAVDPCYGDQFVGGATKCRPFCRSFCWQPGSLLVGLYGRRTCTGVQSSTPCPCGSGLCDRICSRRGCGVASSPVYSPVTSAPVSSCGCAGCSASTGNVQHTTTQIVTHRPATDNATAATKVVNATQTKATIKKTTKEIVR